MGELLVFGYAADPASPARLERMAQFTILVGTACGIEVPMCEAKSYEDLAYAIHRREVDLAWLPPIPLLALSRKRTVAPLVSHHRDGAVSYHSVLVVGAGSAIQSMSGLSGTRAAWVDPHSASGYVLPRIELAALGVDPRSAFGRERFLRSHEAVARAVMDGDADFGATYAGVDRSGAVVRGPWMDVPEGDERVRVLGTCGAIPSDVIAARAEVPAPSRDRVTRALISVSHDKANAMLLRDLFGVDEFRRWSSQGYDELRDAVAAASEGGLLEGEERGT